MTRPWLLAMRGIVWILLLAIAGGRFHHPIWAQPAAGQDQGQGVEALHLSARDAATRDQLLAGLKASRNSSEETSQIKALMALGDFYAGVSGFTLARDAYSEAAAKARSAGSDRQAAAALNGLARCLRNLNQGSEARKSYHDALDLATTANDPAGKATALFGLGVLSATEGNKEEALARFNTALPLARQAGDDRLAGQILRRIGRTYTEAGDERKALDYFGQAVASFRAAGDPIDEADMLNNIGLNHSDLRENAQALESFNQALALYREAADDSGSAQVLVNIGVVHYHSGELAEAMAYYQKALPTYEAAGNPIDTANVLGRMSIIYSLQGEKQTALDYLNKTLPIYRAAGDRRGEANSLNNIGLVYTDLSENQKALECYGQVLKLRRAIGDRNGEAATLNNVGLVYSHMGEVRQALDHYEQALPILHAVDNHSGEATVFRNTGILYAMLGEGQKALDYENRALAIYRTIGDRLGEESTLNNLGSVYSELGNKQKALEYQNQALPLARAVGDRRAEANILSEIGTNSSELGDQQKSIDYYQQALAIYREIDDRREEAEALGNIGAALRARNEKEEAVTYFNEALSAAVTVDDPLAEAEISLNLLRTLKEQQPALAIFYGKHAISRLQQVRRNIEELNEALQKSFLASKRDYYEELADLLIEQGRLSEAQQVLNLLKQQEYKDYVRGEVKEALGSPSLTPVERSAEKDFERSTAKVVEQGRRWAELKQNKARTPGEEEEFQQLSVSLGNASRLMNDYFARLYKLFAEGGDANRQLANITDETASLKEQIARMPHTVALYTVVSKERYSVIVISGPTMVAREYAISDKDLYRKIGAFRQIILEPSRDPKPLAHELYNILIGPVKADLDQAKAETLIWSLDGALRYVPFAALYDGNRYLVEDYSLASFTPVSISRISEKPNLAAVSAAGMGISGKFDEKLQPLPKVETELESVVRDPQMKGAEGVMPGTILLNAKFTVPAMEKQLDGQRSVVHIASHFVMRPGDDSQSYLLLAGTDGGNAGYHMTVAEFRDDPKLTLEGAELLTLSACDTGIGGSSANGREVDGLATTAQRKGARAVISSLWPLNDNSTADLMSDFYKRWIDGGGKVTKAEALRQAQLDLLEGRVRAKPDSSDPDAGTSYALPYYWAPFVLMGNWQ